MNDVEERFADGGGRCDGDRLCAGRAGAAISQPGSAFHLRLSRPAPAPTRSCASTREKVKADHRQEHHRGEPAGRRRQHRDRICRASRSRTATRSWCMAAADLPPTCISTRSRRFRRSMRSRSFATINKQAFMMVVDASKPWKTVAEVTAAMKEKGDKATYATSAPPSIVMGAIYKAGSRPARRSTSTIAPRAISSTTC